jgi:putative peptidoglycan lipid II flippase
VAVTDEVAPGGALARRGAPILFATLVSRPLGFVREAVQAFVFGATRATDAFVIAYNLPELIQNLFFTGALGGFFVPVATRYRADRASRSGVFNAGMDLALVAGVGLAGVSVIAAPWIVGAAAAGMDESGQHLTTILFRLMLPVLVLHCMLAVIKSTLNALDHYTLPECAGIVMNVSFITFALSAGRRWGIYSLVVGVLAGATLQLVIQIPALGARGIRYRPRFRFDHPALRSMKRLALGSVIASSAVPINAFVDRAIASHLSEGAVTWLAYGFRVFMLPVSLFAVPLHTVLLTSLSTLYHAGDEEGFARNLAAGLRLLLFLCLPSSALFAALASPIVRVIYQRGQFASFDTTMTSAALAAYAVGIFAYGTSLVAVRAFNSRHDTRTPAIVAAVLIGMNVVLDIVLMRSFGHWGIALATSIISVLKTITLFGIYRARYGGFEEAAIARAGLRMLGATAVSVVAARAVLGAASGIPGVIGLAMAGASGIGCYLILAFILRMPELRELRGALRGPNAQHRTSNAEH